MRRLAPVGLFSVVVPALLALPVASSPAAPKATPVPPQVQSVPVAGVDPAALADDAGSGTASPSGTGEGATTASGTGTASASGKAKPFLLTPKKATRPFTTVGVTWEPDRDVSEVAVLVRTRAKGGWSSWSELDVADDDGPDATSPEARGARVRTGTAPQWVGKADGVQVRLDVASGAAPRDVRVELVDPGTSDADASLGQSSQPRSTAYAAASRPAIITRAQWGADESLRTAAPAYSSTVKVAYVHHTASTNSYTADQAAQQVRGFYAYHTRSLGWSDIGYNFLVDKFGRIYEGRYGGVERAVLGAHAGGFNTDTMGVSMMGTYTSVAPTSATVTAVQNLLAWKLSLSGRNPLGKAVLTSGGGSTARYPAGTPVTVNVIAGHRDTNLTECPGTLGYGKLPAIRTGVADRMARVTTSTSPIDLKYTALGGTGGFLGAAVTPEGPAVGGRYRHYRGGSIYWSSATGAHEIHGAIYSRWAALNWERGTLRYPVTDERVPPDKVGRYSHFQNGSVYWSPGTGAWEVHGAIRETWGRLGWELGPLGYPVTNESVTPDGVGRYNHFQRGSVYWTPTTGAFEVRGAIRDRWASQGWERSRLGYPTSNEYDVAGGRRSNFQRGQITWNRATGATTVSLSR